MHALQKLHFEIIYWDIDYCDIYRTVYVVWLCYIYISVSSLLLPFPSAGWQVLPLIVSDVMLRARRCGKDACRQEAFYFLYCQIQSWYGG